MSKLQCQYIDDRGGKCIRAGKKRYGYYCVQHREHDHRKEEARAVNEVRKITGMAFDKKDLAEAHKVLMDCIKATAEGKMTPDVLVAISKAIQADCDVAKTGIYRIEIKHKIMLESKKMDPNSPFKVLDVPTLDVLKNISQDAQDVKTLEIDAVTAPQESERIPTF